MTVIPFSVARFTPADLAEFQRIAGPKMQRGLWSSTSRHTGPDFDRIWIQLPGVDRPVFSFERDRRGTYHLLFNDRAGWYSIGWGETAGECLAVWRPRTRPRRAPEDQAVETAAGERA